MKLLQNRWSEEGSAEFHVLLIVVGIAGANVYGALCTSNPFMLMPTADVSCPVTGNGATIFASSISLLNVHSSDNFVDFSKKLLKATDCDKILHADSPGEGGFE
jgi:hypothetical protein